MALRQKAQQKQLFLGKSDLGSQRVRCTVIRAFKLKTLETAREILKEQGIPGKKKANHLAREGSANEYQISKIGTGRPLTIV